MFARTKAPSDGNHLLMKRKISLLLAQALLFLTVGTAGAQGAAVSEPVQLIEGRDYTTVGKEEIASATLRDPSLCRMLDGRICLVYCRIPKIKVRREFQNGAIVAVYSADEGQTWSAPEIIFDSARDDESPSIASTPDGTLVCSFVPHREKGAVGTSLGTHVLTRKPGVTAWSPVMRIAPRYDCSSPVHLMRDGRLILGLSANDETQCAPASVCASPDGTQWEPVVMMGENRPPRLAETDIVERSDGWLFAVCRTQVKNPTAHLYYSISQDAGATWDRPIPLGFVGKRPKLLRTPNASLICAYEDEAVFFRYSKDEGLTFNPPVGVDGPTASAPSLALQADGSVLIAYIRHDLVRIRRFQIEESGPAWKTFTAQGQ